MYTPGRFKGRLPWLFELRLTMIEPHAQITLVLCSGYAHNHMAANTRQSANQPCKIEGPLHNGPLQVKKTVLTRCPLAPRGPARPLGPVAP